MATDSHPRDDLVRSMPPMELRASEDTADDGRIGTLSGHFSVFDAWYEVDSAYEGRFLERVRPGAFAQTFAEDREHMRSTFQHGMDPSIGDKVLGPIETLEEDKRGAKYVVPLIDTSYNRDLLPGLKAGLYGSSFRFSVRGEEWEQKPRKTAHNPDALPERSITDARVLEFGPVTWPASAKASAVARSLTDEWRARASPVIEMPEPPEPTPEPAPSRKESRTVEDIKDPIDEYRDESSQTEAIKAREMRMAEIDTEHQGRELPPDVQAEFDRAVDEIKRLNARIQATQTRRMQIEEARRITTTEVPGDGGQPVQARWSTPNIVKQHTDAEIHDVAAIRGGSRSDEEYRQGMRDNAMRVVERAVYPHPAVPEAAAKAHVARMLDSIDTTDKQLARRIMTTDHPDYRRAFNKSVLGQPLNAAEQRAVMAVGVDATGGFAVPYAMDPTIVPIGAYTPTNPFRAACRVEQIVGTDTWRGVTATAVSATRALEAAAVTDSSPTFAQPEVIVKRVQSAVVYSIEMGQDRPDIGTEMAKLIAEAKDTEEEAAFAVGTGATVNPMGMLSPTANSSFTEVTSDVANIVDIDDIYKVETALPIRYRPNAAWFMNRFVVRAIQALETTTGQLFSGQYYNSVGYPQNSPIGNTGLTLLRYPIWEVPSAVADVTTSSLIYAAFGDPKQYLIVDRVGMSIELIPHFLDAATGYPTGQRILYAVWRNNAKPFNVDGMRRCKVHA